MAKSAVKARVVRPTARQKKLVQEILKSATENGMITLSEIQARAGFSRGTIDKTPGRAFTTAGFKQALADVGLTANSITETLEEARRAGVVTTFRGEAKETDAPDHRTRLQAVAMLAKYTGIDVDRKQTINLNIEGGLEGAKDLFGLG